MTNNDGPVSNSDRRVFVNGTSDIIDRNYRMIGSSNGDDILSRPSIVKSTGFHNDNIDPVVTGSPIPLRKALPFDQTSLYVVPCDDSKTIRTTILDIGKMNNISTTPAVLLSDCDESFASDQTSPERTMPLSNHRQPHNQLPHTFDQQQMGVFGHGLQRMQSRLHGEDTNEQGMVMSSNCSVHPGWPNICPQYMNDLELDLDTIFDDQ